MVQQGQAASAVEPDAKSLQSSALLHKPLAYSSEDFRREIKRLKRKRVASVVIGVIAALLVVLVVVAVAVFKMPSSLQTVNSDDMTPVLMKGQVALTQEADFPVAGDVIAFRSANGPVLFKRVVAVSNEWVNVSSDGAIAVSDVALEGDAASNAIGDGDTIIATRQVPDGACFVMADTETSAIEALYNTDNYISDNQIIGRAAYRVWPITNLGPVS